VRSSFGAPCGGNPVSAAAKVPGRPLSLPTTCGRLAGPVPSRTAARTRPLMTVVAVIFEV